MTELVFDYAIVVLSTATAYAIFCYGTSLLPSRVPQEGPQTLLPTKIEFVG